MRRYSLGFLRRSSMSWSVLSRISLRCGVCALLLLSGACATHFDKMEVDLGNVPFEDAWNAVVEISETDGFVMDPAGTDRGKKIFESVWRTQSVPFRISAGEHRGKRLRVHAEFTQPEGKTNWLVRFYVERQVIGDMTGSMDPQEEHWDSGGQDFEVERRIAAKLAMEFRPGVEGTP
jgi:hypothetical protein